jgi:hypothetical protein
MSRTHHESKVAGGRPRREEQGRIGIWNKEMRILWIFIGMKEGKRVREGRSSGTQMTCLEE